MGECREGGREDLILCGILIFFSSRFPWLCGSELAVSSSETRNETGCVSDAAQETALTSEGRKRHTDSEL